MTMPNVSGARAAAWLFAPVRWVPPPLVTCAFFRLLNLGLAEPLRDGELDFLTDRCLQVRVDDLGLEWRVTLSSRQRLVPTRGTPDVTIAGAAGDLLLIAARREDPDTFFFQRRLRLTGDTELGLNVKNLMDSLELDVLPPPVRWGVERGADWLQRSS